MEGTSGNEANWFNVVQTVGIITSILMGAAAAIREAKAREIENLLTLSEHHRELWQNASQQPGLQRIFQPELDLMAAPATPKEEEFLNLMTVHFLTGWRIAKAGGITSLEEMKADVRGVFALPLPRVVWEKTKKFRNQRFVRFVERALQVDDPH